MHGPLLETPVHGAKVERVRTDALLRSLSAVAVVFRNPEMRRLQLAWGAESLAIWSFAIALGVYALEYFVLT